ncbi:uncharacterized protein DFL_005160 [Arthrobotrys flagrans]|uniref:Uncharacterized protein n=1 Tax=Arthrobotrys flagrans TaxID=97331 RepID=A0A437A6W0_ARTFL|nr:hypothetical protein DFL_005160 [Arthrobotrys flagrans]
MEELVLYTPKILLYIFKIVPSLGRSGIPGLGMITTANPTLHNPVMPLELGVTKRTVKPQNAQYNLRADFPVKDHVGAPIKLLGMFTSHVGLTDCQSIGVYLTDEEHGFATISGLSVKFHGQKDQQLSGNALILGTIHEERFFEIVEFDVSSGEELQGILIHRAIKPIGSEHVLCYGILDDVREEFDVWPEVRDERKLPSEIAMVKLERHLVWAFNDSLK